MLLKTTARCASIAQVDAALVRFKNRIQFAELVPELRLCMAASKCTQRNKRANRTKRLGIKQFLRVAQTERACAANIGATFPFCRPISLKELGKVLAKTGRCVSWLSEVSRICEYFGGTGRLLPSRNALSCICGVTKVPAKGENNGSHRRGSFQSEQCHAAQERSALRIGATGRLHIGATGRMWRQQRVSDTEGRPRRQKRALSFGSKEGFRYCRCERGIVVLRAAPDSDRRCDQSHLAGAGAVRSIQIRISKPAFQYL